MVAAKKKKVSKRKVAKKPEPAHTKFGAEINALGLRRNKIRAAEKKLVATKAEFEEDCIALRTKLVKAKLEGALGNKFTASVSERENASIDDYNKFQKYVFRTKSLDLLQSRVSITAVRERMADGKTVPGVAIYKKPVLNLRVRSKK